MCNYTLSPSNFDDEGAADSGGLGLLGNRWTAGGDQVGRWKARYVPILQIIPLAGHVRLPASDPANRTVDGKELQN